MSGHKMVRVSLEREIEHAAMMAIIRCRRASREFDRHVKLYRINAWVFTSTRNGKPQEYLLAENLPDWFYRLKFSPIHVCYSSPKGQSMRPVNVSGLSIQDRQHLIDSLSKFE